jgi:hypothetical protein
MQHIGPNKCEFVRKEFISPIEKQSTATIIAYHGSIINYDGDLEEGGYLEMSDCRRKVRIHTSSDHTPEEYIALVRKIEKVCKEYADFLESKL